ncbi:acyl-CoA thioesterase [Bacillus horti]|uniref:Acyl-CoA thioester hydrolase n=1 Tax=Caldalkalibacillus horti TaxID=77523 RepID=A0ABT9VU38_9BACI|nr:thioesterase family protein [Bacillus horti]MDQ0164357.1 acyl-CoA thioester hydrolase [Bacillus horti]
MKHIDFIQPTLEEWIAGFKFETEVKVRFSETDAFGHVNNVSHIIYFEQARLDFFENAKVFATFLEPNTPTLIVTADIHCHYIRQIYYTQRLKVKVKVGHVGSSSLDLQYAILDQKTNELLAAARGAIVHVDKKTGKSVAWPELLKEALYNYIS